MARKKQKSKGPSARALSGIAQSRPGMPALDSVQEVKNFVSPQGDKYKILKTTEMDTYDPPIAKPKNRGKGRSKD